MLDRFHKKTARSAPSLLQQLRSMFKRPGERISYPSDVVTQSHDWNIPIPPHLMYHIIDSHLDRFTKLPLCAAFPCLQPYCYPKTYRHISVTIECSWNPLHRFFVSITLSTSALDEDNSINITTLDDLGYADDVERAHGVVSLVANLTHGITSCRLNITIKWRELDNYMKAFITALLRCRSLCSVKLQNVDIPVNLLGLARNLKTLDLHKSPGRPENVFFSIGRKKVRLEKIILRSGVEDGLFGLGSPFDWSGLREIEYHNSNGGAVIIQKLLKMCSAPLHRLYII